MAHIGFNFRATTAYVTDGSGDSRPSYDGFGAATYPETLGNGATCGWESSPDGIDARDRSTGVDVHLAGLQFPRGASVATFRVDLASSGSKDIRLASGDYSNSLSNNQNLVIRDTTTTLATPMNNLTGVAQHHYRDANGVDRTSESDWASNNTILNLTWSTTIARFDIGGSSSANMPINYIGIDDAGGGGGSTFAARLSLLGVGR